MNRPRLAAVLIAVTAVVASACGGADSNRPAAGGTTPSRPVIALTSVEQFAAAFNADNGTPRLIMPIAPT